VGGLSVAFLSSLKMASYARIVLPPLFALSLAACGGGLTGFPGSAPPAPPVQAPVKPQPPAISGPTIGNGSVKIGLILPLTGSGQGSLAANALRNAAEMAVAEFQNPDVQILVKDDKGTGDGAREATAQALSEGAELVIGPLFAASVQSAGAVTRQAGKPMIAFSTDPSVAARGVYLLSFMAQSEVNRIIDFAASQGKRSMAAMIPDNNYGNVVEATFREAAARRGIRVIALERYAPGQVQTAISKLAPAINGASPQADALFLPESANGLPQVAQALQASGFNPQKVKPLGTGIWNDPRLFRLGALQGGWFAAPDNAGFNAFAVRYRNRFGSEPARLATLSYDAVSLAAALVRTQGSQRFSESVITNANGFNGADGVFRFRSDGTNDRGLSVLEIRGGGAVTISAAPKQLGS
jgi:hypothetical protein